MVKFKKEKPGLIDGRIGWGMDENIICRYFGHMGKYYARVISQATGMSIGQVYYRLRQMGISLRDVRGAETPVDKKFVRDLTIGIIKQARIIQIQRTLPAVKAGKNRKQAHS